MPKQHPDGFICREIRADGSDCFERYDPTSTGPNLLPWVELTYYRQFGDIDRLHKVFPALCAYAKWWRLNRTWPDGTYWSSGWGTGMDNMPRVKPEYNPIFSHGHMVWLDTNLQQMLVDESLLNIGFYIERWQEIEDMEDEMKRLRAYVNEHLWDERTAFLYDRYGDGTLCTTKGIGAFWALQADALDRERLDRMVAHLSDTTEFDRPHRVPSLSADHPKYNPLAATGRGGVWPGTNYMTIDGLYRKGYHDLAPGDRREPLRRSLRGVEEYRHLLGVLRPGEDRTRIHGTQGLRGLDRTSAHRRLHRVYPRREVGLLRRPHRVGHRAYRGPRHRTLSLRAGRRRGAEGQTTRFGRRDALRER